MTDKQKPRELERPYRLSVGEELWRKALNDHAPPGIRKRIEEMGGLHGLRGTDTIRGMGGNMNAIRENIQFALICSAIQHLRASKAKRISAGTIAKLLTTKVFSISSDNILDLIIDKYPFLIDKYGLFIRSHGIDKEYADAIRILWRKFDRKPSIQDLADRLGLTSAAVRQKLTTDNGPAWLTELYELGPEKNGGPTK